MRNFLEREFHVVPHPEYLLRFLSHHIQGQIYLGCVLKVFTLTGTPLMYLDQGSRMFTEHASLTFVGQCVALIICNRVQPGSKAGFTLKPVDGSICSE